MPQLPRNQCVVRKSSGVASVTHWHRCAGCDETWRCDDEKAHPSDGWGQLNYLRFSPWCADNMTRYCRECREEEI